MPLNKKKTNQTEITILGGGFGGVGVLQSIQSAPLSWWLDIDYW